MKGHISLKLSITLAFLSLAVVLVIGYSFLSAHYYKLGMITITANEMEQTAQAYIEEVPSSQRDKINYFRFFRIARNWKQMPDNVQKAFGVKPSKPGLSIAEEGHYWFKSADFLHFVYIYRDSDDTLFVNRTVSKATAPAIIDRYIRESEKMLFSISASIVGVLAIVISLIMRRVSKPMTALKEWVTSLDSKNLSQTPPDFAYPEINDLAALVRTSLSLVQESLEREHNFLRHASHELRTPIAIVRNNVELLHKLEKQPALAAQRQQVIGRIDRAGLTMQHLTETLLWLSRNDVESLPGRSIELDGHIKELVDELNYLLARKNVELKIKTSPYTMVLPEFPTRIVLGNLIRNAFQHSMEGLITIEQVANRVVISNPQSSEGSTALDQGFGLGLQLTVKLSTKLGWHYQNDSIGEKHTATLTLNNTVLKRDSATTAKNNLNMERL